jgi:S1-C subfamily serine protease
VEYNGVAILTPDDLAQAVKAITIGQKVVLQVQRNGKIALINVTIKEK